MAASEPLEEKEEKTAENAEDKTEEKTDEMTEEKTEEMTEEKENGGGGDCEEEELGDIEDILVDATKVDEKSGEKEKKAKKDKKGDKEKKEKKGKREREDESGVTEKAQSAQSNQSLVAEGCPAELVVEASGKKSIDGRYTLVPAAFKGRAAYKLQASKKQNDMYLYCKAKGAEWRFGPEIGAGGCIMSVQDCGLPVPAEPYPHIWRLYQRNDSGEKVQVPVLAMRVVNAGIGEDPLRFVRFIEAPVEGAEGTDAEAAVQPTKKSKKSHKKVVQKGEPLEPMEVDSKGEASASAVGNGDSPKAKAEASSGATASTDASVGEKKADAEQQVSKTEAPKDGGEAAGEAEGRESSSESSEAEEDEAKSDSSDESSAEEAQPKSSASADEAKAAATAANLAAQVQKRDAFEARLRGQFSKLNGGVAVKAKLEQVKSALAKQETMVHLGYSQAEVTALLESLAKEFQKTAPKAPPRPPPKHLLKQDAREDGVVSKAAPPKSEGGPLHAHRKFQVAPSISKLRNKWGPKHANRIGFKDSTQTLPGAAPQPLHKEVSVESFRSWGSQLWFQAPGQIVECDTCEKTVPQAHGCLQGAPEKSQFAQMRFICCECIGAQVVANSGNYGED